MPEIYDHLTIGFNATVRRLELVASSREPKILSDDTNTSAAQDDTATKLSVVFVCRKSLPDTMTSSLPSLMAASSSAGERAKLVDISTEAEELIARALHQPRVGVLGIEVATPGADALLRAVQDNIPAIEVPWLDQKMPPTYNSVKIHTSVTPAKSKSAVQNDKRKNPAIS